MKQAQDTRSYAACAKNMASTAAMSICAHTAWAVICTLMQVDYVQLRGPNGSGTNHIAPSSWADPFEVGTIFVREVDVIPQDIPSKLDIGYLGHDDGLHPGFNSV